METFVVRLWLPDRPGALGAVASRIGSVRGDVVGIDILESGGGRAIDELVVELPDDSLIELLVHEIEQVEDVRVEVVRPAGESLHDPRLDALETASRLVGADAPDDLLRALCVHGGRTLGATWAAVVEIDGGRVLAGTGASPAGPWLTAFVAGSRAAASAGTDPYEVGPDDVAWAPMPAAGFALVFGRAGTPFRARERRQVGALARIADTRHRELSRSRSRTSHPSHG
jgi:hypothetical protein